jgi:hypothetical protein
LAAVQAEELDLLAATAAVLLPIREREAVGPAGQLQAQQEPERAAMALPFGFIGSLCSPLPDLRHKLIREARRACLCRLSGEGSTDVPFKPRPFY